MTPVASTKPNTIVLIHGLWLTPLAWEHWIERYRTLGYNVLAPPWPGIKGDVEDMRRDASGLDHVGVGEIVDHYTRVIRELERPPIIIGHSFGGLIAQMLLDRGLGHAGVAMDSAPPKGVVRLPWSSLRSAFPALKNPANSHRTVMLSLEQFHFSFANTLSPEDVVAAYERYAIPGPGRVLFQAAFANLNPRAVTAIDFHNDERSPLLIVTGEMDNVSPPSLNKAIAKLQHRSKSITAYKEFSGRTHFIFGQPGWQEVADFALDWALAPKELSVPSRAAAASRASRARSFIDSLRH